MKAHNFTAFEGCAKTFKGTISEYMQNSKKQLPNDQLLARNEYCHKVSEYYVFEQPKLSLHLLNTVTEKNQEDPISKYRKC
jgi:hypothetical protein